MITWERYIREQDDIAESIMHASRVSCSPVSVGKVLGCLSEGPGRFYRQTYKYTDCGPSVGFQISDRGWVYCDDLYELGTWKDMKKRQQHVYALSVSSIVEGVEQTTENIVVPVKPLATLAKRFDAAVSAVDQEAHDIWNETHGCEKCGPVNKGTDFYNGYRPVNPKCRACKGKGTIL